MCQKIAIAQALLPASGLLVLDEAWTGLDQAARATLDEAVLERAADGGQVIFVDHDPARLAGVEGDSLARLAELPGVLSAARIAAGHDQEAGAYPDRRGRGETGRTSVAVARGRA